MIVAAGLPAAAQASTSYTQVDAGAQEGCAVTQEKTVKCWGSTPSSMTGVRKASRVSVGPSGPCAIMRYGKLSCMDGTLLENAIELSAGGDTSQPFQCAIISGGTLKCWGSNTDGQLGDGSQTDRTNPVTTTTGAVKIDTGARHACAIKNSGSAICWGDNTEGQLGNGTTNPSSSPVTVSGLSAVSAIAAGYRHSCAVSEGAVKCWGDNYHGQLGDGTTTDRTSPVAVSGTQGASSVSTGNGFSCALIGTAVKCWGYNLYGQLGDGTTTSRTSPVAVSGANSIQQISSGNDFSCGLQSAGSIVCWGQGRDGQLGNGYQSTAAIPSAVQALSNTQDISTGNNFSCGLINNGTVKCWGDNSQGQMGSGVGAPQPTAQNVPGISTATKLDSGTVQNCVLLSNATVSCWGNIRNYGVQTPTVFSGLSSVSEIAVGATHGCARKSTGRVQCWGSNSSGQLGTGGVEPMDWLDVSGLTDATKVAAGEDHSCALRSGGSVQCWGKNNYGQLGDGSQTNRSSPVNVAGLSGVADIEAGGDLTCARLDNGTAKCWGNGTSGQLGHGQYNSSSSPVTVSGLSSVTDLSVGNYNACAVNAGSGYCWGQGVDGQLGNGTTGQNFAVPQRLAGNPAVSKVSASWTNSCFTTPQGGALCSGQKESGAIGDGSLSYATAATTIIEPTGPEPDFFDPDPPTIRSIELSEVANSQAVTHRLTVTWNAPEWDGDAPIVEYQVNAAAPQPSALPQGADAAPGFCKTDGNARECTMPIKAAAWTAAVLGMPVNYQVRVTARSSKGPWGTWSAPSEIKTQVVNLRCADPLNITGSSSCAKKEVNPNNPEDPEEEDSAPEAPKAKIKTQGRSVNASFKTETGVSYTIAATKLTKAASKIKGKCKANKKTKKTECRIKLKRGKWNLTITPRKDGVNGEPYSKRVTIR